MANTRELNDRIKSLENMQKVMRAMNMISSVKFARHFPLFERLKVYEVALETLHRDLGQALAGSDHPLLGRNRTVQRIHIVLMTADRGLCGSHNNSLLRALDHYVAQQKTRALGLELTCLGTKGLDHAKRQAYQVVQAAPIAENKLGKQTLAGLQEALTQGFLRGEIQEVVVIYNRFRSVLDQVTTIQRILPLMGDPGGQGAQKLASPALVEPEGEGFVPRAAALMTGYFLKAALAHSYLSEHASRMTAMENATNNAKDMADRYALVRNRLRQSGITSELIEIISGKEALKG